jgi:hypothetical protein
MTQRSAYVYAFAFIGLLTALGLALSLPVDDEVLRIVIFGVISLVLGLVVSRFQLIEKAAADRIYYALGIVGVCAFFASDSPQRQEDRRLVRRTQQAIELTAVIERRAVLESIAMNPDEFLSAVRSGIQHLKSSLFAEVSGEKCRQSLSNPPSGEPTSPLGDIYDRCLVLTSISKGTDWSIGDALNSLADLKMIRTEFQDSYRNVYVDLATGQRFSWKELSAMLFADSETLNLDARRAVLVDEETELRQAIAQEVTPDVSAGQARLRQFLGSFWPVLLISLAGLKLARAA